MLSRALVFLLPIVIAAASACSDDKAPGPTLPSDSESDPRKGRTPRDDDATNSAADSPAVRDVCATLDYGHERSNDDFYMHFADDDAAFAYSKSFLEANGMPQGDKVSHDQRLVGLAGKVYAAMRKVFPAETKGLEDPPLIITVKDNTVNAFAGFDERPDYDKAPWMFWVHNGTLNADIPDEQLEGLFAHELAHLVLRNYLPETRAKIRTHYRVPGRKEVGVIGAVTADAPDVHERAEELRTLGRLVSRDFVSKSLPYSPFEESDYQSMLTTLHAQQQTSPNQDACNTVDNDVNRLKGLYQGAASVHDIRLSLSEDERAALEALGEAAATAMKKCYAHVKMSIFELKIRDRTTDQPKDAVDEFVKNALDPSTEEYAYAYPLLMRNDVEKNVDKKTDATTIERLLEIVSTLHARVTQLENNRDLPIDELRVFDLEEDADDAAVRVMRVLGKDPLSAAHLYVSQMNDPDKCYASVKSGVVPAYGRFIDPHNATCWRWFHTNQLAKALEDCPTLPRESSTKTSSEASMSKADRSPMETLRRLGSKAGER